MKTEIKTEIIHVVITYRDSWGNLAKETFSGTEEALQAWTDLGELLEEVRSKNKEKFDKMMNPPTRSKKKP